MAIRQNGLVVAHSDALSWSAMRTLQSKKMDGTDVHAWVTGFITDSGMGTTATEASKLPRIHYSVSCGIFHHNLTNLPLRKREIKQALIVALNSRGMFSSYFD